MLFPDEVKGEAEPHEENVMKNMTGVDHIRWEGGFRSREFPTDFIGFVFQFSWKFSPFSLQPSWGACTSVTDNIWDVGFWIMESQDDLGCV